MEAPMAKGTPVVQVVPAPIEGTVTDLRFDADGLRFDYEVSWSDADGAHTRWFTSDQIKAKE